MIQRLIVCPIIQNSENEILICKMPKDKGAYPGKWALPGGGVEPQEKMLDALKREIKEELGDELKITKISPFEFRDAVALKHFADKTKKEIYMIFLIFDCLAENKSITLNDEFESYAWVKIDELKNYDLNEQTKITFQNKNFL
ncbi:MAG: nucleoside triphosphatase NudI [Parachlamydiales bacterium]|nr:nucleoside triphosphatase NudI [Parachlamydiales bacterium]